MCIFCILNQKCKYINKCCTALLCRAGLYWRMEEASGSLEPFIHQVAGHCTGCCYNVCTELLSAGGRDEPAVLPGQQDGVQAAGGERAQVHTSEI